MGRHKGIVAMRITRKRRETIQQLAESISDIAPATSYGSSFCLQQVAQGSGLGELWRPGANKRAMIVGFLERLFRRYPRRPKRIVMEIVKGGVEWRARRGKPVTPAELHGIVETMRALGFDIEKEVDRLELPEPSRVSEPSASLVALLDRLPLHEALADDCAQMFRDGHFNEAVRKALERFEKLVQDAIGDHKRYGRDLMAKAFSESRPLIALNEMKTANDESEQQGFKLLTMGAMSGMRNLYSHGDVAQMPPEDALERLAFVSLLFKRVVAAIGIALSEVQKPC